MVWHSAFYPSRNVLWKKLYGFLGISRRMLQSQRVPCCCLLLQSESVWLGSVQIISSRLSFPQVDYNQGDKDIKWCLCFISFFFSIKPRRKRLNRLKGQDNVAAPTYNLWEWSDLWGFLFFFVCLFVPGLQRGWKMGLLQEEVASAALCSWKNGGTCPHSTLPGVRYTLEGHAGIVREPGLPEKPEQPWTTLSLVDKQTLVWITRDCFNV